MEAWGATSSGTKDGAASQAAGARVRVHTLAALASKLSSLHTAV